MYFVDYAIDRSVNIDDIREINKDFVEAPTFAMCGCLSGVKPLDKFWTEVLLDNFSDMVKDRILYADVKKYETAVRSEMTELNNAAHAILINIYCMNFRKTNTICCCSIRMARRTYKSTDC